MRNYILIKDETYSSTLFDNYTESLAEESNCSFVGAEPYKVKLMTREKAGELLDSHPMLLSVSRESFDKNPSAHLTLVSFGGAVVPVKIKRLMLLADRYGSCTMMSQAGSTSEAENLQNIKYSTPKGVKNSKGAHYAYLTLVKLQGTQVYYLITNPKLVQCTGHIEIESDLWIQQIKGKRNTLRDSIFNLEIIPDKVGNNIMSGGLCVIDMLGESIIQPEDRLDFYNSLDIQTKTPPNAEAIADTSDGYHVAVAHDGSSFVKIKIKNELLGDFINDNEKLEWEFLILGT